MSNELEFVDGMIIKAPHQNAPDFVIGKGSIKVSEMIEWLQNRQTEWVNFDMKISKGGKWYVAVDAWEKPKDEEYKEGMAQARHVAQRGGQPPQQQQGRTTNYQDQGVPDGQQGGPSFDEDSDIPF